MVSLLQPHYPELLVAFRLPGEQRLAWVVRPDDHDLRAYLNDWFALAPSADLDGVVGVDVFDLLTFLDCWFTVSAGGDCSPF